MNRQDIALQIIERLNPKKESLKKDFFLSDRINSCFIDDLLDESLALNIAHSFPRKEEMSQRKTLSEYKYVAVQMDRYSPILEEIIYAFQDPRVLSLIQDITGFSTLLPDENLYAGGISLMDQGCFLNPHLDNSHDKDRKNFRVLNILYYVSPDWKESSGGNLELWDNGLKSKPRTIVSKFNRLVIMITNRISYHSVNQVLADSQRCCVSNYYFSPISAENNDYFHVTSFRGRPEEKMKDFVLSADILLRNGIRKFFPKGLVKPWHVYKK